MCVKYFVVVGNYVLEVECDPIPLDTDVVDEYDPNDVWCELVREKQSDGTYAVVESCCGIIDFDYVADVVAEAGYPELAEVFNAVCVPDQSKRQRQ